MAPGLCSRVWYKAREWIPGAKHFDNVSSGQDTCLGSTARGCYTDAVSEYDAEPGSAKWVRQGSNLRSLSTADLQSASFNHSDTYPNNDARHIRTCE